MGLEGAIEEANRAYDPPAGCPRLWCDAPGLERPTTAATTALLKGWAFTPSAPATVTVELDGCVLRTRQHVPREDVAAAFEDVPHAHVSGWMLRMNTADLPPGRYPVTITAHGADGATTSVHRELEVDRVGTYARWLEYRRQSLPGRADLRRLLATASPPRFLICMLGSELADATSRSLGDQLYRLWSLATSRTAAAALDELLTGTDDYLVFAQAGDVLQPHALFALAECAITDDPPHVLYADEDELDERAGRQEPFFKPGWSPELLVETDYVGSFVALDRVAAQAALDADPAPPTTRYDLLLRLIDTPTRVQHIADVLCSRRPAQPVHDGDGERDAVRMLARRRGKVARVSELEGGARHRVEWELDGEPRVSVVIATTLRDGFAARCLRSIAERTTYPNVEIVLVRNNVDSTSRPDPFPSDLAPVVVDYSGSFNYSAINNAGAAAATGDYLLFVNDDTEVDTPDWIDRLLEQAQQPGVGVVGGKLLYADGMLQLSGVLLTNDEHGARAMGAGLPASDPGYHGLYLGPRNSSSVGGACMMVRRDLFDASGGFDSALGVELGDVDLCLRVLERGERVVWTPRAVLIHNERASRGSETHPRDHARFRLRWARLLDAGDPYYNRNLSMDASMEYELRLPDWNQEVEDEDQDGRESGERFVPETMPGLIHAEHEARYRWVSPLVRGRRVLDAACGVGYGSLICAQAGATATVGIDVDPEAIEDAVFRAGEEVEFRTGNLERLPFADASFDLALCFEAIEHVEDQGAALDELKRVVGPEGVLVISSPNRNVYPPGNPYHLHEYTPAELRDSLEQRFEQVALYRQHPWLASFVTDDSGMTTKDGAVRVAAAVHKVEASEPGGEMYTLALASDRELPRLPGLVTLAETADLRFWQARVRQLQREVGRLQQDRDALKQERVARQENDEALCEEQDALRQERDALRAAIELLQPTPRRGTRAALQGLIGRGRLGSHSK